MNKKIVFVMSFLISLVLISNVLAITASIGNARMVLRDVNLGDRVEKYVRVINDNDVAVNILLTASGDLENYISIKEDSFTLQPGEEKDAYFTILIGKAGNTASKISVRFTPVGEKNGAGISSDVIVISNGTGEDLPFETDFYGTNSYQIKKITGKVIDSFKVTRTNVALWMTGFMFILFIVLLILYYKFKNRDIEKSKKKNSGKKDLQRKGATKSKKKVNKRG